MSDSYTSSSYYYSSTTNTTDGSTTTGHRYTTTSHTDPDGNTIVRTATQDLGAPAIIEERRYDRTGQEQLLPAAAGMSSAGGVKRITDLDEEGETGATTHDPGTAYRPGNTASALDEGGGESVADVKQAGDAGGGGGGGGGEELGRLTYDSGPAFGGRTHDPSTGAYDESVVMDSDGVVQQRARERHHHRVHGRYHGAGDYSGYYATEAGGSGGRVVGFENIRGRF